jgi:hypothetical protein
VTADPAVFALWLDLSPYGYDQVRAVEEWRPRRRSTADYLTWAEIQRLARSSEADVCAAESLLRFEDLPGDRRSA